MLEIPQNLRLFDGFLSLLLVHVIDADFFDNKQLPCLLLANQISLAKRSFPKQLLLLIDLILGFEYSDLHCETN